MAAPTLGAMLQAIGSPPEWGAVPIGSSLAKLYLEVTQTGIASGGGYIVLDAISYDPGNNVSLPGYYCPVTGIYRISARTNIYASGIVIQSAYSAVYVNGALALFGSGISNATAVAICDRFRSVVAGSLKLNADDYLQLYAYCTTTDSSPFTVTYGESSTFLAIELISQG